MEDAAEAVMSLNCTPGWTGRLWNRQLLLDPLVRTGGVVVRHKLAHHVPQMGLVQNDDMIEAFLPDGSNPSLRKGVGIGSLIGCEQDLNAFRSKDGIKGM